MGVKIDIEKLVELADKMRINETIVEKMED